MGMAVSHLLVNCNLLPRNLIFIILRITTRSIHGKLAIGANSDIYKKHTTKIIKTRAIPEPVASLFTFSHQDSTLLG